jgi:catechol 2,3-dioxygenase-like lactoylglutathione lyase family enzyme
MEELRAPLDVCSGSSAGRFAHSEAPDRSRPDMQFSDVTPNLIVSDIDRSLRFYRDVLGFSVVATVPDVAPFVFTWLQRGGISVFLNAREGVAEDLPGLAARPIGGTNTLFMVIEADSVEFGVDALYAQIAGNAPVVMPLKTQFYGMREFGIEDPDGYVILFAQRTVS